MQLAGQHIANQKQVNLELYVGNQPVPVPANIEHDVRTDRIPAWEASNALGLQGQRCRTPDNRAH
jgi:hypothetical protein